MNTTEQKTTEAAIDGNTNVMCRYPLATKSGIELMFAYLLHNGDMCPKCGYGTRKTSKRWAKCKRCNERVQRGGNGT